MKRILLDKTFEDTLALMHNGFPKIDDMDVVGKHRSSALSASRCELLEEWS